MAKLLEENNMTLEERKRNPSVAAFLDSLTKTEAPEIMDAKLSIEIDIAMMLANMADTLSVINKRLINIEKGET